ncbi:hypothetical protein OIO90_001112 [Microbotryomycetes sp. JL221]|nr:hypothetical protein OIO90_001112 [Microbotryomycetes sp. JL221]
MPASTSSTSISNAGDVASRAPYTPATRSERTVPIRRSARACSYCRKSKARCDGPELWPCRRCRESGQECLFEGVPQEELGTKNLGPPTEDGLPRRPGSPYSMERRLIALEREMELLKQTQNEHSARLGLPASTSNDTPRRYSLPDPPPHSGDISLPPLLNGNGEHKEELADISLDDPAIEGLARTALDTFWTSLAPWAPYMDPNLDTYDLLRVRSPLLLFCILAITSRYHAQPAFAHYCEQQALSHMRATLYSEVPPTLDDCKGTTLYNAWLSRGSPPGHSLTLAAQLELPQSLGKLLSSVNKPSAEATRAFDKFMPLVRVWLTLYCQDLWLSVATGRRSMVTIDYSITSARSLLKFAALRPVDARMVAQCELVTILGGVQESFLKVKQSIAEAVKIVQQADEHLDFWMKTWSEWAKLQEGATGTYMAASFAMQLQVGRFYISTLGLKDIASESDIQPEQKPVIKTAIDAAMEAQGVTVMYGPDRMAHATEFTLISTSSAALFLLKMIKLMPDLVPDVQAVLTAVHTTSRLLAGAPRQNYHMAVAGALTHLESHLLSPTFAKKLSPAAMTPMNSSKTNEAPSTATPASSKTNGSSALGLIGTEDPMIFDPDLAELEISISSVVGTSDFWSWSQTLPADSFQGLLS